MKLLSNTQVFDCFHSTQQSKLKVRTWSDFLTRDFINFLIYFLKMA